MASMKTKALIIGRIRSKKIQLCLKHAYCEVTYISSRDYITSELNYSEIDEIVIATNPYVKKSDVKKITSRIKKSGITSVIYLNTYYSKYLDRYQLLKKQELEEYCKYISVLALNIPFLIENNKELIGLQKRVNARYCIPYIFTTDIVRSLIEGNDISSEIKFIKGEYKRLSLFPKSLQKLLWNNELVKFQLVNISFKLIEKMLFWSANSISTSFLIHKSNIENE